MTLQPFNTNSLTATANPAKTAKSGDKFSSQIVGLAKLAALAVATGIFFLESWVRDLAVLAGLAVAALANVTGKDRFLYRIIYWKEFNVFISQI